MWSLVFEVIGVWSLRWSDAVVCSNIERSSSIPTTTWWRTRLPKLHSSFSMRKVCVQVQMGRLRCETRNW